MNWLNVESIKPAKINHLNLTQIFLASFKTTKACCTMLFLMYIELPCCKTAVLVGLWVVAEAASGLFRLDVAKYLRQIE